MSAIRIRAATAADLPAVVDVFVACWRRAYRGIVPDGVIARWDEPAARAHWGRLLEAVDQSVAVADAGGDVVGVVRFGPDPETPAYGYLASLYVHPDHGGGGIGRRLLEHAESSLEQAGFRAVRLWVFTTNSPAIDFYRRCGWRNDGRSRLEEEYTVPETGMIRVLGRGREMVSEMAEQPVLLRALLDRRAQLLDAVRAAVPEAPRGIVLVARGSSDNAAVYGRYVLELALRRPVSLAAPSFWTRYGLEEELDGHLAIAVSQSGHTPEIVATLAALSTAGAAAMAVTNDAESPLARAADTTVDLAVGAEHAVPATKTFTAQLAAFALIAEALGRPTWASTDWDAVPPAQADVLSDPQPAADAAEVIAGGTGSVHLGRGLLYAVALESALKLAETSSLPAAGYSAADFLHGPLAAASPQTTAIAYIAPGPVAADVRQAVAASRDAGAPVIAVGEEVEPGALPVRVPAGIPEALAPLVHALRAQQLAAATTLALGGDPDRPRALSKMTMTD